MSYLAISLLTYIVYRQGMRILKLERQIKTIKRNSHGQQRETGFYT